MALSDRWRFFLVGRQDVDDVRGNTGKRMTALGENVAVAGGPDGCLLHLRQGRLQIQNLDDLGVIDVAEATVRQQEASSAA